MKFKPPPNRKRVEPPPSSSLSENKDRDGRMRISMALEVGQTSNVKKAQNYAMVEAHQDGCTGNFRIFESAFGNYLVPVIPSRAELDN